MRTRMTNKIEKRLYARLDFAWKESAKLKEENQQLRELLAASESAHTTQIQLLTKRIEELERANQLQAK